MWRMHAIEDTRLTVISDFNIATYSGMMPGVLAQQYPPGRMQIDLVRLCAATGARLVTGEVTEIDTTARRVIMADRPAVPYDALSIGVGSRPVPLPGSSTPPPGAPPVVPIKPMQTFLTRLQQQLEELPADCRQKLRVVIAGAGAGGVEIAFCLRPFVESVLPTAQLEVAIVGAGDDVLGSFAISRTRQLVRNEFEKRNIQCVMGQRITALSDKAVVLQGGGEAAADLVILATGARSPAVLKCASLPRDDRGFLLVRPTLQSTGDDHVFVVGDSGTLVENPPPKAGVYAVRQAPVLWQNLQRLLRGKPLQHYRPQSGFLSILNTGDGRGIAEYKGFALHSKWCFKLKDAIDGAFMDKYQNVEPMPMTAPEPATDQQMRCVGCGGKVGGNVLRTAIERLQPQEAGKAPQLTHGLSAADDTAVIQPVSGFDITATTDFFTAPIDDPYLMGRIAALHAASDIYASGGQPVAALAMAVLPVGPVQQQQQMLYEILSGATAEFAAMQTSLAGGHTIEGAALTIGFSIIGNQPAGRILAKSQLSPGDALVLTSPLGTGVLLAAHMRAECPADAYAAAMQCMLQSNQQAAALFEEFKIAACTDVTGFGLAGHLLEMLNASDVSATLHLRDVQFITGAAALAADGIASTLLPANQENEIQITVEQSLRKTPEYNLMFDPQTSGGLLIAAPPARADEFVARLKQAGYDHAAIIGQVQPANAAAGPDKRLTVI